jgi:hypothetical protein
MHFRLIFELVFLRWPAVVRSRRRRGSLRRDLALPMQDRAH